MTLRLHHVLAAVMLMLSAAGAAQEPDVSTIHWAYSTWFGTGWYQVGDERDAFVIRYAPRRALRETSLNDDGSRSIGMELRLPITIGLNHFPLDDLPGSVDPDNLANVSITPGIYFDVPIDERWMLRPFAAFGWGTVLNAGESAWTYWTGVRSRLGFEAGRWDGALLNSIGFVGYSPNRGPSANFWPIMTAVEMAAPLGSGGQHERPWVLNAHAGYTYFMADLDIVRRDLTTEPIKDQWELGLAFSRAGGPMRIWRFNFDRLGLAYRTSSDGELKGVGLVFESLFDH